MKVAQDYWNQKGSVSSASGSQYGDRNNRAQQTTISAGQGQDLASLLAQLDATPLSQRHVEADGLVFDPRTITKKTAEVSSFHTAIITTLFHTARCLL